MLDLRVVAPWKWEPVYVMRLARHRRASRPVQYPMTDRTAAWGLLSVAYLQWFWKMDRVGLEQTGLPPENNDSKTESGTNSGTLAPELVEIVAAWPSLAPAIRAGIMAMVKASGGHG